MVTCEKYFWEKDEEENDIEIENDPPLTEEEVAVMDSLPIINLLPSEVILPNGMTLEDYLKEMDSLFYEQWNKSSSGTMEMGPRDVKNLLIAKMNMVAISLSDRSLFTFQEEGDDAPAHYGLPTGWSSPIAPDLHGKTARPIMNG